MAKIRPKDLGPLDLRGYIKFRTFRGTGRLRNILIHFLADLPVEVSVVLPSSHQDERNHTRADKMTRQRFGKAIVGGQVLLPFCLFIALIVTVAIQDVSLLSPILESVTQKPSRRAAAAETGGEFMDRRFIRSQKLDPTSLRLESMGLTPIFNAETTRDPWKVQLFQRLDRIRIVCGVLCQMNTIEDLQKNLVEVPGSVFPMAQIAPVDCPAILGSEDLDASDHSAPRIPEELLPYFTFNGSLIVTEHELRRDIYLGAPSTKIWKEAEIKRMVGIVADGTLQGTYGANSTAWFRDDVGQLPIRDKSLLVIGSETPWVEVILLYFGAAKVTTLEYADIVSEHPKLKTLRPSQFRERFLAGTLEQFDGIVTHSSLEHSGLGRYGDALNPWGDILAVARAWCVTKQGGFMYLGLPTGSDTVMSNWHRTYGLTRWPLVAANWKPLPSTSDGTELHRGLWQAFKNGGFGYKFTKP